jgi:hypothetical protein
MEKKRLVREGVSGRRKWVKPKLIVIARGDGQERVLLNCKGSGGSGPAFSECNSGPTYCVISGPS